MKEEEFKVLTSKEEAKLTPEEKKEYYEKLREYVLKRKLKTTTPGARFWGPKLKGVTNKIAEKVTDLFTADGAKVTVDGQENIPEGSVIFAFSHQGLLDNFVWIPTTDKHCYILHSAKTSKLLLACQLNTGLVLVKKGDKQNNADAKLDTIRLLLEGHSIAWFPESAWNLSPNKLLLPMSYGFLDAARKAGKPVVPAVFEYTYDTSKDKETITNVHIRFGEPIYINENDDIKEKFEEFLEKEATMRYELIEEKGVFPRSSVSNQDYANYLKGCIKNLEFGKIDINVERAHLFGANDEFYQFHHINDVPVSEDGEFEDTKEVARLKALKLQRDLKKFNVE